MSSYRIDLPEPFSGNDGQDFRHWVKRFEVAVDAAQDSSAKKEFLLPSRLSSSAFTVWDSLPASEKSDYSKTKKALQSVFGGSAYIKNFQSCITARVRDQDEPLEVYAASLSTLVVEAFPDYDNNAQNGEKFRRFMAGIDAQLRRKVYELGAEKFDDALEYAIRIERATKLTQPENRTTVAATSEEQHLADKLDSVLSRIEKLEMGHKSPPRKREIRYQSPSPPRRDHYSQSTHRSRRDTSYDRRRTPSFDRNSLYDRRRTPSFDRNSSYDRRHTPSFDRDSSYDRRRTPSFDRDSSYDRRRTPSFDRSRNRHRDLSPYRYRRTSPFNDEQRHPSIDQPRDQRRHQQNSYHHGRQYSPSRDIPREQRHSSPTWDRRRSPHYNERRHRSQRDQDRSHYSTQSDWKSSPRSHHVQFEDQENYE